MLYLQQERQKKSWKQCFLSCHMTRSRILIRCTGVFTLPPEFVTLSLCSMNIQDSPVQCVLLLQGGKPAISPALDVDPWLSTVQDPADWAIIHVTSTIPTFELLEELLRTAVEELFRWAELQASLAPSPLFHFPGRFSTWYAIRTHFSSRVAHEYLTLYLTLRYANEEQKTTGCVEMSRKLSFDQSFIISTWVRRRGG